MAAITHDALRPTADLDCLARRSAENMARLAAAMRELNARLRVAGLTDAEGRALPTPLDAEAPRPYAVLELAHRRRRLRRADRDRRT